MPNTGSLSGRTPGTSYALDAVHVDAWGNVSAVVSSATFTTDAAAAGIGTPVRLLAAPYADSAEASATHTTANVTPTGGRPLVIVVHGQAGITSAETVSAATFGGTSVTPHETVTNEVRTHTWIYVVENPGTSAQAFSITFVNTPRSVLIEILEIPGAATTATVGNAMTTAQGDGTSASVSGTTGTNGSLVLYALSKAHTVDTITVSGADASLSPQDSGDTNNFRDVQTLIAWETVATAGAASASFSWATASDYAAVGIEVKAA